MQYTFRPCTLEDFDFLFELKKQNFKYYVEEIWGWNDEDQKDRLRKDLEEHLEHKRIILVDDKEIGIYAVHITEDGDLFINEISLLKEYQKKGIGTDILQKQLEENKAKGIRTILQVFKDNPAKRLYEKLGFTVYNQTETHYQMENNGKGNINMIKNIVFDLGRVIVNFNPIKYLEPFGFDSDTNKILTEIIFKSKDWIECDSGKYANNSDLVEILCGRYPELEEKIRLVLNKDWVKMLTLKEDSVEFLKSLKQEGFKIYILSNLSEESYNFISKYDFFNLVEGGVYSYQLKICKPQPEIYNELLSKYNLCPEETIFIDDSKENIDMANKLNIHGVIFNNLEEAKQEVEALIEANKTTKM